MIINDVLVEERRYTGSLTPPNDIENVSPRGSDGVFDTAITWVRLVSGVWVPHYTGTATSNIEFAAIFNNVNSVWLSFWFRLTTAFDIGSAADLWLFGKYNDATNFLYARLVAATGGTQISHKEGAGTEYVNSTQVAWEANRWYHWLGSCSTVNGQRLRVDGNVVDAKVGNVSPITLTATFVLGSLRDGNAAGFIGETAFLRIGTFDLTPAQEWTLYQIQRGWFGQ